jgi:hypothetical protein
MHFGGRVVVYLDRDAKLLSYQPVEVPSRDFRASVTSTEPKQGAVSFAAYSLGAYILAFKGAIRRLLSHNATVKALG